MESPIIQRQQPITGYRIYRSTSSNSEGFLTAVGNVTSYRDKSTTSGIVYYYEVTAVNSAGESPCPTKPVPGLDRSSVTVRR